MQRTESNPTPPRYWRAPRRPVVIAVAAVAGVTAVLWGVRWWGPINPAVDVGWSSAAGDWSTITLEITNQSQSPVSIESVALTRLGADDTVTTPVASVAIEPQSTAPVTVALPTCRTGTRSALDVELGVRNAVGMPVVLADVLQADTCPAGPDIVPRPPATVVLPEPGTQPADVPAARTGVTQAYWTVYDGSRTAAERGSMIDDPTGIDAAYAEAPRPVDDTTLTALRSDVRAIVFDTPAHAWVDYGLAFGLTAGDSQVGEAVLVEGTWKVTRTTVCRDLLQLNVTCPP